MKLPLTRRRAPSGGAGAERGDSPDGSDEAKPLNGDVGTEPEYRAEAVAKAEPAKSAPDAEQTTTRAPSPILLEAEPAEETEGNENTHRAVLRPSPTPRSTGERDSSESAGDDTESSTRPSAATMAGRPSRSRRVVLGTVAMAVLTVAVLVGGAFVGVQWREAQATESARQQVLSLAREQSIAIMTINSRNVDGQMKSILDNATGDFKRQFGAVQGTFGQVVRQGNVNSTGTVDEAGVSELNEDSATVLVALRSTVKNAQSPPEGTPRMYRMSVKLSKEGEKWLISGMQFVP